MKQLILIILFFAFSCKRDKPVIPDQQAVSGIQPGEGVFIINEGNFMWGNAEVFYYRFSDGAIFQNMFSEKNGIPLGDVAQSMEIINDKGYIVLNNSGKIEIVNLNDFSSAGTITGFSSPRYSRVAGNKLFVTDLYSDSVSIADLQNNTIISSVPFGGWSEELIFINNKLYIGNQQNNFILVVDPSNEIAIDTIVAGNYCNSMVTDQNGMIWALCSGQAGVNATLHKIDPDTDSIVSTLAFPSGNSPWRLKINGAKNILYYFDSDLYSFSITTSTLPTTPVVTEGTRTFYSLGIDPATGDIYIGDAVDYVQSGIVYIYHSDGTFVKQFYSGIIPGEFCFY